MIETKRRRRTDQESSVRRWIALDPFTLDVVAEGTTFHEAQARAEGHGVANPLIHPVI